MENGTVNQSYQINTSPGKYDEIDNEIKKDIFKYKFK